MYTYTQNVEYSVSHRGDYMYITLRDAQHFNSELRVARPLTQHHLGLLLARLQAHQRANIEPVPQNVSNSVLEMDGVSSKNLSSNA